MKIHFSHAGMEIFMEKKRRLSSLKKKIIVFVILCWGVPIAVFFAYTTSSYRKGIIEKTEGLMEDQLENMASFASIRIEDAITLCQRPSYEKTWENAWKKYLGGRLFQKRLSSGMSIPACAESSIWTSVLICMPTTATELKIRRAFLRAPASR